MASTKISATIPILHLLTFKTKTEWGKYPNLRESKREGERERIQQTIKCYPTSVGLYSTAS